MKVIFLIFSIFFYVAAFSLDCRSEYSVLKECTEGHKDDLEHWVCYAMGAHTDCKGQDKTYYKCSEFRICQYNPAESVSVPIGNPTGKQSRPAATIK